LIEHTIQEFHQPERVNREVQNFSDGWNGHYVALDDGEVVGAAGGGLMLDSGGTELGKHAAALYAIYVVPDRKQPESGVSKGMRYYCVHTAELGGC